MTQTAAHDWELWSTTARLVVTDTVELIDLNSANGILVAGSLTRRVVLGPDDVAVLGDSQLRVASLIRTTGSDAKAQGVADRVTLFTQSDFGRTFAPNQSSGTDHAWGNQQLVMGAAVAGGTAYGRYPELVIRGPDDVGTADWEREGRWIPTQSVDQYAATLLRWWGLTEPQLDQALPNLRNFGSARNLGFMRA